MPVMRIDGHMHHAGVPLSYIGPDGQHLDIELNFACGSGHTLECDGVGFSEPCNIARSCTAVSDATITRAATQAWRFVRTQHNVMRSHQ